MSTLLFFKSGPLGVIKRGLPFNVTLLSVAKWYMQRATLWWPGWRLLNMWGYVSAVVSILVIYSAGLKRWAV